MTSSLLSRAFWTPRLDTPPVTGNAALDSWLQRATDAVNALPPMSVFSFVTPNSNVSGVPGTIGVNQASNTTVLWYKQSGFGNTGWDSLATTRAY